MARQPETPEYLKLGLQHRNEFDDRVAAVKTIIRDVGSIVLNTEASEASMANQRAADSNDSLPPSAGAYTSGPQWSQSHTVRVHHQSVSLQIQQGVHTYQNWSTLQTVNTNSIQHQNQHMYRSEASHTANAYIHPRSPHENYMRPRIIHPVNVAVVPVPVVYVGWAPAIVYQGTPSYHAPPVQTVPVQTVPVQTVPVQTVPVQTPMTGNQRVQVYAQASYNLSHQNFSQPTPQASRMHSQNSRGFYCPPQGKNCWGCQAATQFDIRSEDLPGTISSPAVSGQISPPQEPTNISSMPASRVSSSSLNNVSPELQTPMTGRNQRVPVYAQASYNLSHQNFSQPTPQASMMHSQNSRGFYCPPQGKNCWGCQAATQFDIRSEDLPSTISSTTVSGQIIPPQEPTNASSMPALNNVQYPQVSSSSLNNVSPELQLSTSNSQEIPANIEEPSSDDLSLYDSSEEEGSDNSEIDSSFCEESSGSLDSCSSLELNTISEETESEDAQNFSEFRYSSQAEPIPERQNPTFFNARSSDVAANILDRDKILLRKSSNEERSSSQKLPDTLFNVPDKPVNDFDRQNIFAPDIPFEPKGPSIRQCIPEKETSNLARTARNVLSLNLKQSRAPPGFSAPAIKNEPIPTPNINSNELNPDDFDDTGPKFCSFCHNNEMRPKDYLDHNLRTVNKYGTTVLTCPVLRSYVCSKCGATGDDAHTITHCPVLIKELGRKPQSVANALKKTPHNANGKLRRH